MTNCWRTFSSLFSLLITSLLLPVQPRQMLGQRCALGFWHGVMECRSCSTAVHLSEWEQNLPKPLPCKLEESSD